MQLIFCTIHLKSKDIRRICFYFDMKEVLFFARFLPKEPNYTITVNKLDIVTKLCCF